MNIAVLILPLSFGEENEPRFIPQKKAEVSKRQYSSKAKGSNVRDFLPVIGTVLLTSIFSRKSDYCAFAELSLVVTQKNRFRKFRGRI